MALQKNPFPNISWPEILNQISAKSKAKDKLPTWFETRNIIYPAKISIEQTSSEITALYKSQIVSGKSLIDLTGGFGVDALYFSKKAEKVIHCEINPDLSEIVRHNFEMMQVSNIECIHGDSLEILKNRNEIFDWIYIDPSRRNDVKGKVFMLKDCLPDVPGLLDFYFNFSNSILIKTAPVLDISAGLAELKNVKEIHIVALENEVKELLWVLEKGYQATILVKTINLLKDKNQEFSFELGNTANSDYGNVCNYLYEPNPAIMKSGGFNEIGIQLGLDKLHKHSHLFTSEKIIDFPGRAFKVRENIPYNKSEMKLFENGKFNITTRNFPESVENIRKKWKIKDGGDLYCFFTTDANDNKIVLICSKI